MIRIRHRKHSVKSRRIWAVVYAAASLLFISAGLFTLWIATLPIPDVKSFEDRKVTESTKIYDRTGKVLLYDTGTDIKRTIVPLTDISPYVPEATIAIEDSNFYHNIGIEPISMLRAALADVLSGRFDQGASTITQQVVKNSLLTTDKTVVRKIKEVVLAVKLTMAMSKDQIIETYLNEAPYGGTIYGIEEASQEFFGHPAKDDTLAESAYLAAIPQAPTYYSPYGLHRTDLDARQHIVLQRMLDLKLITQDQYHSAISAKVQFLPQASSGIRAPHFVMYVKDYLVNKYGEDTVDNGGLKVITTLDYDMQQKAEQTVSKFAPDLKTNFNAGNMGLVAIDPKTGDILSMLGSEDYFDASIDGSYNVALAQRQPGSTFKPFVYATAFEKGYTPETELFDVQTQFSTQCTVDGKTINPSDDPSKVCYSPVEYDGQYEGPMTMRYALAESRNIPAIKTLYLAGIQNSLSTAESMGVTVTNPSSCGLTLVLGGCDVTLLDMVSAYSVFANDGVRNPYRSVLEVDDSDGNILEKAALSSSRVLPAAVADQINSVLSDRTVMMNSIKPLANNVGRPVAIKTGTTNDYRDVWTMGYTPDLAVGMWAGNNDNTPMEQKISSLIITPVWGAFMAQVAKNFPPDNFNPPPPPLTDGKPVLRGIWQGGISYWKDTVSGKVATQYTPPETRQEVVFHNVHTILYWLDKDDPRGAPPADPTQDPQFKYWEYGVRKWFGSWQASNPGFKETTDVTIPSATDDVHVPANFPQVSISSPTDGSSIDKNSLLNIKLNETGKFAPIKTEVYLNGKYIMTASTDPLAFSFVPADIGDLSDTNTISVTVIDSVYDRASATTTFDVASP
ncbi:MAG: transglycosylase domain-containing protein [Patescibacteria group bacterium]|nr:transglycosylase domain-containing protein [Patescibacteria group bacterium]